jgi:hypothetical protein
VVIAFFGDEVNSGLAYLVVGERTPDETDEYYAPSWMNNRCIPK